MEKRTLLELASDGDCERLRVWIDKASAAPLRVEFTFGAYELAQTATDDGFVVISMPCMKGIKRTGMSVPCQRPSPSSSAHVVEYTAPQLTTVPDDNNKLLGSIANDLMIPLGLVSGPLDDLKQEIASDDAVQLLKLARRNVGRLRSLVTTLIEVSSMKHSQESADFVRTNLGAFTREISAVFIKSFEKSSSSLNVNCDLADKPVYIDRQSWEKIIVALLRMATHYNNGCVHKRRC